MNDKSSSFVLWVCLIVRAWVSWLLIIIVGMKPAPLRFGKPIIISCKTECNLRLTHKFQGGVGTHPWTTRMLTHMRVTCIVPPLHAHQTRIYFNEAIWLYTHDKTLRICYLLTSSFPSLSATPNLDCLHAIDLTPHFFFFIMWGRSGQQQSWENLSIAIFSWAYFLDLRNMI